MAFFQADSSVLQGAADGGGCEPNQAQCLDSWPNTGGFVRLLSITQSHVGVEASMTTNISGHNTEQRHTAAVAARLSPSIQ